MVNSVLFASDSLPKARTKDLVVQESGDEVLVYDLLSNKAHQLNETMALIWKKCDGATTVGTVVEELEAETKTELDSDFVSLALHELERLDLISNNGQSRFGKVSRRDIAFKYAPTMVLLPIAVSLVAPAAVQAQSCIDISNPCTTMPDNCCPGLDCVPDFFGQGQPGCFFEAPPNGPVIL